MVIDKAFLNGEVSSVVELKSSRKVLPPAVAAAVLRGTSQRGPFSQGLDITLRSTAWLPACKYSIAEHIKFRCWMI